MTITDNLHNQNGEKSNTCVPQFSSATKAKIRKAQCNQLLNDEYVPLFKEIAETSIKFYSPKIGQYVAIQLSDGKIVATENTKYNLLTKIQEKDYPSQLFIWKVP
jgi:hypothetical protein